MDDLDRILLLSQTILTPTMTRWKEKESQNFEFELEGNEEESRLIKKFYDYIDLENTEKERRRSLEGKSVEKISKFGKFQSIVLPVLGGGILMGLTFGFLSLWGFR